MGATLDVDLRRRVRCPAASAVEHDAAGMVPSIVCGVVEEANRREPQSEEVPALVSARTSTPTVVAFCTGQGQTRNPRPRAHFEELAGKLTLSQAHDTFSYTDCPVWLEEQERLERVKHGEGQAARLQPAGVERIGHDPHARLPDLDELRELAEYRLADRPDGPPSGAGA